MRMHPVDAILGLLFALLIALLAIVIFAHRPELRAVAMIFMVIGYPCLLGLLVQFDTRIIK